MPLTDQTLRRVSVTWEAYPNATGYQIERRALPGGGFAPVTTVSALSHQDEVLPGSYEYRITALGEAGALASSVRTTEALPLDFDPAPLYWYDVIDRSGDSLTWDETDPDFPGLIEWRDRRFVSGDPIGLVWGGPAESAPELTPENSVYFGEGFPGIRFPNPTNDAAARSVWLEGSGALAAIEPPCTVIFFADRFTTTITNIPRCYLQLGKFALYGSVGNENIGLRVDGGFIDSGIEMTIVSHSLIAVVARSESDIDIHRIRAQSGVWTSALGLSGAAWENHGEFSMGARLVEPYHAARFLTVGFAAWNLALDRTPLEKFVNIMVNSNNLHYDI